MPLLGALRQAGSRRVVVEPLKHEIFAEYEPFARSFRRRALDCLINGVWKQDTYNDLHAGHPSSEAPRPFSIQRRQLILLSPVQRSEGGRSSSAGGESALTAQYRAAW